MAGAINLANVALGFDASKIQKGVGLSSGEMRKLNGIFRDSIAPVDRYNADLTILEKAHKAGALSADRMSQAMKSLQDKYKQGIPDAKQFSMPWTELNSGLDLVTRGFGYLQAAARPVFDEMNRIDAINDQAHKLGMSYRDLNTIQLALGESSGASADDVAKSLQKLSIGVTEAIQTGKGAHAEALRTLGLDAGVIGGMKGIEQIEAITNAMANINSQAERLQLTFDLFGKTGSQLVSAFDEGGGKLAEMAAFADEVGLNLSGPVVEGINNANDSLGRLSMATQGWIAQLTGGAAPALGVIADHLTNAAKAGEGTAKSGELLGDFVQNVYSVINDAMKNPAGMMGLGGLAFSAMTGTTQQELTMQTLLAQGKAEEQAKEKERLAQQFKERQGMEAKAEQQKAEAKKRELEEEKKAIQELKDYEEWMTSKVKDIEKIEKEREIATEFKRREAHILTEAAIKRDKFTRDNQGGVTENSAPSLRAGSVEAYKFMLAQKDKLAEQGEKVLKVQEDIRDTMNRQLDELKSQAKFTRSRN